MRKLFAFLALLILAFPGQGHAGDTREMAKKYRLDVGIFDGRIARTQSGNTIPFNTSNGSYISGEIHYGDRYRALIGGSYYKYPGKVVTATSVSETPLYYSDLKAGFALAFAWSEWRLIYMQHKTPYTDLPDVNTLVPHTVGVDYLRLESILYAKASGYSLAFVYFLNQALNHPDVISGGQFRSRYFIGGCVRVLFGDQVRIGPGVCIDLQEGTLPSDAVVNREEVHARLTLEF